MDRNIRYEALQTEDSYVPDTPDAAIAMDTPPPVYVANENTTGTDDTVTPPAPPGYTMNLPSYKVATELPSYEEAERTKNDEANRAPTTDPEAPPPAPEPVHTDHEQAQYAGMAIGTDGIFLCTFIISFLFNWLGFLASLCISNTVAGRCGALSGLGLSIVKWAAIVKHNKWMDDYVNSTDAWIWWILIICGFIIFVRGCIQYIRVKYEWKRITGQLHRYYLLN